MTIVPVRYRIRELVALRNRIAFFEGPISILTIRGLIIRKTQGIIYVYVKLKNYGVSWGERKTHPKGGKRDGKKETSRRA